MDFILNPSVKNQSRESVGSKMEAQDLVAVKRLIALPGFVSIFKWKQIIIFKIQEYEGYYGLGMNMLLFTCIF